MKSSVETLAGLQRKMTVVLPPEHIEPKYHERLKEYAKTAQIKGFRPGKAPLKIIEQKMGESIRFDVIAKLIESSFYEATQENKLKIAGQPNVSPGEIKKDQSMTYTATFEIYPDIIFKKIDGETLEVPSAELTDKDTTGMLTHLQKQHVAFKEVNRASKNGDKVLIDFEGTVDGKPFNGNTAKNFHLELGSKNMIPGFEEGIVGMKPDDEKTIQVTFPEDYHAKDLAGKKSEFKIKLHKVEEAELPELNDEFAKKLGVEDLETLKKDIRETMERNLKNKLWELKKTRVLNKLLEKNSIEVPRALVEMEIDNMHVMAKQQFAQIRGVEWPKDKALPREPYMEQATKQVKLGLLLAEFIKENNIKIDEERVKAKIEELAKNYQQPEKMIEAYRQNKQILAQMNAGLMRQLAQGMGVLSSTSVTFP
ncbi:MAG: trigger factor [Gammaproteobacteria bacterium RIFOXYB2_FULL_38_6]|nr:MAG: trigger factor [Gammaproteobacteria bacterium RIFOXYB2_FULL_38_6]